MKGWGECFYPWIPHNPNTPQLHSLPICSETALAVLSHTSRHPSARSCVFLIHYLKERNVAHTKINIALLDQTMCHSDSSSKEAVVLTGGGWNSLALQSVCHSALCLYHTAAHTLITWFRPKYINLKWIAFIHNTQAWNQIPWLQIGSCFGWTRARFLGF